MIESINIMDYLIYFLQLEQVVKKKMKMKTVIFFLIISLWGVICSGQPGRTEPLIVDHTFASKFINIPDSAIASIIKIKLMFRHASVGTTINNGLYCLQGTRSNPAECKL
jgi:hypothetical protein